MGIFISIYKGLGGLCVLLIDFIFYYFCFVWFIYYKNNKSIPKKIIYLTLFFLIVICLIALILSLVLEDFKQYIGFSISYLVKILFYLLLIINFLYYNFYCILKIFYFERELN